MSSNIQKLLNHKQLYIKQLNICKHLKLLSSFKLLNSHVNNIKRSVSNKLTTSVSQTSLKQLNSNKPDDYINPNTFF